MEQRSLQSIKGVGAKREEALARLGIYSVDDLLHYLPRDYYDYSRAVPVAALIDGQAVAVLVRISGAPKYFRKGTMAILSVTASDETGTVTLRWFNQPYVRAKIVAGALVYACGRVSKRKGTALINPSLCSELPGIQPVYPTVHGVTQRTIRASVFAALQANWTQIAETLPLSLLSEHALCTRQLALRHAHFPASMSLLTIARKRLSFEDMLCYLLMVESFKRERTRAIGISFDTAGVRARFLKKFSYLPTDAQLSAMDALDADMRAPVPMNRLLQGDVGSGKTFVALYALTVAAANGYQGVLLAPTEILAEQHYEAARDIFGEATVLLTGSMKKATRAAALTRIENGTALCIIGTHALLQSDVRFDRLGVVVTDEQHRFGVEQRARIQEKGVRPDVLVMSATPIPRTLALLLFGDLDSTTLDELPPRRKPVKTSIVPPNKRDAMYRYVAAEAANGAQTYVVCPMIEDSDEMDAKSVDAVYAELARIMPDVAVGKLHGRMREQEKLAVMQAFRDGNVRVLVTTTVIEVGVHVPAANVMIIEGADRFGLSQLHQLRGRVGRGEKQAYCFLLTDADSDTAMERMQIMTESTDGFVIAQRDLELRGPGDFIGLRQHGESATALLCSGMALPLIEEVKAAAAEITEMPSDENNALLAYARARYMHIAGQIAMN